MELWTQPIPSLRSLRLCRMLANEVPVRDSPIRLHCFCVAKPRSLQVLCACLERSTHLSSPGDICLSVACLLQAARAALTMESRVRGLHAPKQRVQKIKVGGKARLLVSWLKQMKCRQNWQGHVFLLEPSFLKFCPSLTELNLGQSSFIHTGVRLLHAPPLCVASPPPWMSLPTPDDWLRNSPAAAILRSGFLVPDAPFCVLSSLPVPRRCLFPHTLPTA